MTRARRHAARSTCPVRYHHRPRGIDDAHGYGKPSRFLTAEVLACCDVTRLPRRPAEPLRRADRDAPAGHVSPDSLFD